MIVPFGFMKARVTGGLSDEVIAAFLNYDTYGDGLTNDEKTWMETYIDAEVSDLNHTKKDNETIYPLSGANSLVDYIGGKVSTLIDSPTHSISGYTLNGTSQRINTEYNPSIDATNFTQNDAQIEVFLVSDVLQNWAALFGNYGTPFIALFSADSTTLWAYLNQNAETIFNTSSYDAESLYALVRSGAGVIDIFQEGVSVHSSTEASTGIHNSKILVGSYNEVNPLNGVVSTCMIGAALADNPAHNTNLRTLLTSLGTI